ncbi:hypothetical protein [Marinobacter sp. BGYM27]|uniref:hypothetical protein n=1 Tax=Marinobacter sp. BGYM27 TaxID=2975597 RepID=UPI0021A37F67|nr:hypothetical protein [Marinobacter sp. BGYM27]MDG5498268.1 hypothetical protein [Marinobacter sp. BGYM27]
MYNRIDLTLRPCRGIAIAALGFWALLFATFATIGVVYTIYGAAGALLLIPSFVRATQTGLLGRGSQPVASLQVRHGTLSVVLHNGESRAVTVDGASRLYASLALLKLNDATTTHTEYTVMLSQLPGLRNVDPETFRCMRVWLRFASQSPQRNLEPAA